MKMLIRHASILTTMAMLTACQIGQNTPSVCKDGQYCTKCKKTYVQASMPGKTVFYTPKKNCPTCGGKLSQCTVCQ